MIKIIPDIVPNLIDGEDRLARLSLSKLNPSTGDVLYRFSRSDQIDVKSAVDAARRAQSEWARIPSPKRSEMLLEFVNGMKRRADEISRIVTLETGKSQKDAVAETCGAIACGLFYVGEGQRLYGKSCTSGTPNKYAMTIRQPVGIAGLIIAANTPIANVAWKIFPAMICGNSVVLKAPEDTPATVWIVGEIARETGIPAGVLNIVHGLGPEAGQPLVEHPDIGVVSFTGSTEVGRIIAEKCATRLAKVSLELGGKNPLVVCDDADLNKAVYWVLASAFSNAGQRCASASRIIVFEAIYDRFLEMLIAAVQKLSVGTGDVDYYGPVINLRQLNNMLKAIDRAKSEGVTVLTGGVRLDDSTHAKGYYLAPTLIEGAHPDAEISRKELFGPIACLYRVASFEEALSLANRSDYGLTACIHTRSFSRATEFTQRVEAGVVVVNAGTYGSEPHMPFGGLKKSGNGTREPGTEALDIYSELKNIYLNVDPTEL